MVFYHLSGAQILRIFRKPKRREEGIVPGTFAAMIPKQINRSSLTAESQTSQLKARSDKPKARPEEIWVMYKINSPKANSSKLKASRVTMISAWRYPGTTKPGERPPIPEDIAEMLEKGVY